MRCAYCEAEFTPKNVRGRFCSAECRAASWQDHRRAELVSLEEHAARLLTRLRALQGKLSATGCRCVNE